MDIVERILKLIIDNTNFDENQESYLLLGDNFRFML